MIPLVCLFSVAHTIQARTTSALDLVRESSVRIVGTPRAEPRGRGGVEMAADYWEVVALSSPAVENRLNKDSDVDTRLHNRHLVVRGTRTATILAAVRLLRRCLSFGAEVLRCGCVDRLQKCFRDHFFDRGYTGGQPADPRADTGKPSHCCCDCLLLLWP